MLKYTYQLLVPIHFVIYSVDNLRCSEKHPLQADSEWEFSWKRGYSANDTTASFITRSCQRSSKSQRQDHKKFHFIPLQVENSTELSPLNASYSRWKISNLRCLSREISYRFDLIITIAICLPLEITPENGNQKLIERVI